MYSGVEIFSQNMNVNVTPAMAVDTKRYVNRAKVI